MPSLSFIMSINLAFWVLLSPALSDHINALNEIEHFVKSNSLRSLNLVTLQSEKDEKRVKNLMKSLLSNNTLVKRFDLAEMEMRSFHVVRENFLISDITNEKDWLNILPFLSHIQVQSTILVSSWNFNEGDVPSNGLNAHAYLLKTSTSTWYEVTCLNQTEFALIRPMDVGVVGNQRSMRRLNLDFRNISLKSMDLTWDPISGAENCQENQNCEPEGIGSELGVVAASLLNLSVNIHREAKGNWGVLPTEGDMRWKNASWTGVKGCVIYGHCHLSLSAWIMQADRTDVVDMAWLFTEKRVTVLSPSAPGVDLGLFWKPFTPPAWKATFIMLLLVLVCIILSLCNSREDTNAWSFRVAYTSGMMLWLLINSFYSGALTMFFSAEAEIPFDSLEDVIEAYPAWKLIMTEGSEIHFRPLVAHSEVFADFWERIEAKAAETVVSNDLEGLKQVANEKAVLTLSNHVFNFMVNTVLTNKMFTIAIRSQEKTYRSVMFPDNSPLTEAFEFALLHLNQHGIYSRIHRKWAPPLKGFHKVGDTDDMVLTAGQVILIFVVMAAGFAVALLALCFEICFHRSKRGKGQQPRRRIQSKSISMGRRNYIESE